MPANYLIKSIFFVALTRRGVDCPLRGVYQVTSGERNCAGRLISGCNRTQQMNIRCGPKQSSNTREFTYRIIHLKVFPCFTCPILSSGQQIYLMWFSYFSVDITLECLSTWRQPEKTLILVRNVNYETGPIGCIVSVIQDSILSCRFSKLMECPHNMNETSLARHSLHNGKILFCLQKLISHSNYLEFSSEDACYGGVSPLFNAPISFAISSIPGKLSLCSFKQFVHIL